MLSFNDAVMLHNNRRRLMILKIAEPELYDLVEVKRVPVNLIADKLNIKQPSVSQWLSGVKKVPAKHQDGLSQLQLEVEVLFSKERLERGPSCVPSPSMIASIKDAVVEAQRDKFEGD